MRLVMLDAMDLEALGGDRKRKRRGLRDPREAGLHANPVQCERRHLQRMPRLGPEPRPRIARHRQRADITPPHARGRTRTGRRRHRGQRTRRKAGRVLDPR